MTQRQMHKQSPPQHGNQEHTAQPAGIKNVFPDVSVSLNLFRAAQLVSASYRQLDWTQRVFLQLFHVRVFFTAQLSFSLEGHSAFIGRNLVNLVSFSDFLKRF